MGHNIGASRELSIKYGSYEVGDDTDRQIDGKWRLDNDYESTTVSFDFIIANQNLGIFESEVRAAEAAFRKPRQKLVVRQGGAILVDLNPSNSTGYNAVPSISKSGDDHDTGRSRKYTASVRVEKPADLPGQSGRRDSSVEVSFEPGRRRILTISGIYTAIGDTAARAQYDASIGAYQAAVIAGLGGTWELVSEVPTTDDTDKNCQFTRVLEEIIFNQTAADLNDAEIVKQNITIDRITDRPGDSPEAGPVNRLETVQIVADLFLDSELTTDLQTKYDDVIRPYLLGLPGSTFGFGSGGLVNENLILDRTTNHISVNMTLKMVGAGNIIEFTRITQINDDAGLAIIPVWDKKIHSKVVFQGQANLTRTITESKIRIGSRAELEFSTGNGEIVNLLTRDQESQQIVGVNVPGVDAAGGANQGDLVGSGDRWQKIGKNGSEQLIEIGQTGDSISVIATSIVTQEVWIEEPTQAAVSGRVFT